MTDVETPITRDDLHASFQSLKSDIDRTADDAKSKVLTAGVILAVVILVLAYLAGKRVGKTESTVVEIRRI